jgi:hypothetical protein
MFFQPIRCHLLKTLFKAPRSFASSGSFWVAFKSSTDAIAGMVYSILTQSALLRQKSKHSADRHSVKNKKPTPVKEIGFFMIRHFIATTTGFG